MTASVMAGKRLGGIEQKRKRTHDMDHSVVIAGGRSVKRVQMVGNRESYNKD